MPIIEDDEWAVMMAAPKTRSQGDQPPFDFWPYLDTIPEADFDGHDCSGGVVEWVWRADDGEWEHVLVNSETPNVFMVVVLDIKAGAVRGHRLLDLNQHYGVTPPSA